MKARFCCDCGEEITRETRPRWGGPRCSGCRALVRPRPGLVAALAIVTASAIGFGLGRLASPAPPPPPPAITPVPAAERPAPPPPPEEPLHPCGARTKRGTRCKRLVRGEGRCWQHGGRKATPAAN